VTDKQKQCLLCYMDCLPPSGIDGIWGQQSAQATRLAQEKLGLPADGIFGQNTEGEVLNALINGIGQPGEPQAQDIPLWWSGIRHFTREEFRCRCGRYHAPYCGGFPAEPDRTLVELADDLRAFFGSPAIPSSGLRCPRHNADSGGVSNSRHLTGKALDFMIQGVTAEALLARAQADERTRYAYIIGSGPYVHIDVA